MKPIKGVLIVFICSVIGTLFGVICLCIPEILPFGVTLTAVSASCAVTAGMFCLVYLE